jgi:hypothetical protein
MKTEINIIRQQVMSFQEGGGEESEKRRRFRIAYNECARAVRWMVVLFLRKIGKHFC